MYFSSVYEESSLLIKSSSENGNNSTLGLRAESSRASSASLTTPFEAVKLDDRDTYNCRIEKLNGTISGYVVR
jgi:hypothetical protein